MNITVKEIAFRFCNEVPLRKATCVGHHKLEDMPSCFNVDS